MTVNLDRAREIGRMLLEIESAISQARTAHSNYNLSSDSVGRINWGFYETELFRELDAQRSRLRTELRMMG